ncbi:alpha-ketoglutarate-dependent dioxygenase AlkB [Gordonia sp. SMJS1]|uniref:alpha-ketoglutarate-dependent dioxygenase AlkB n=1 Tax=unclassified Gordonia (in: high G+C Gram-positive bacteria) TaxID=2657482 RepID=UPI0024560818|nr:alpha-ketoglutarate-dependent dioxygenase AlkB [Gordonia sp. SMJS1]WGJ86648.1 alpha-ketoglutarate-dependent dioxygenase AlkB [Gordonia sp. SMJS1]
MSLGTQGSLFSEQSAQPTLGDLSTSISRRTLTEGAWVDLCPGWISGADDLFDRLRECVPWRAERRRMYERVVEVPRLVSIYQADDRFPDPIITGARAALTEHYRDELPEGFATAGISLYRDGNDSVAWHGDRIGRASTHDTMVAIISLGSPRPLMLRPRGGGRSLKFTLSSGDLLVMGGSCQRTWEHAVPKVRGVGARISIQLRPPGVW